jgi:hypothetical protein
MDFSYISYAQYSLHKVHKMDTSSMPVNIFHLQNYSADFNGI